ncbi:hypothetical protein [Butyrivibrio sp. AE2015]|nr:hypothetical protein [Butyrivibrio sp. AE2015]
MSIAVAPECLYPFDAEDWKDGSKFFYDKDLVEYEDGPYTFRR